MVKYQTILNMFSKNKTSTSLLLFKTNIKKLFKNRIHETKKENESGIYKLNCKCGSSYIGKTFRPFKKENI